MAAEQAEKDADAALQQARLSVRDARDHVNRLVAEAEAEAKAARLKQQGAQDLGRRAQPLGRKFERTTFQVLGTDICRTRSILDNPSLHRAATKKPPKYNGSNRLSEEVVARMTCTRTGVEDLLVCKDLPQYHLI